MSLPKDQQYKIIAGQNNIDAITDFLSFLAMEASNVTTKMPEGVQDSLELRKFIHNYLENTVAELRRIRNNRRQVSSVVAED